MHSLLLRGEYETREGTVEIARLFFAWLALFLRLPYYLGAWHRSQEKRRDKGTVRFHYKKTKFIPCFVHASEIYFIFYVLQVNFFCVDLGRFRSFQGL